MSKIYLRCSAKAKTSQYGERLIIGVKAEELIRFANEHKNERGYINLIVSKRKEPGQYGDTHSVALDDFQPRQQADGYSAPSAGIDDESIPF